MCQVATSNGHRRKVRRSVLAVFVAAAMALALAPVAAAESPPSSSNESTRSFVTVSESQFLDAARQPLLLHGINVVNKSKAEGYTKNIEPSDFATIRSWGMNCVRLGILWDGLEPQPGKIDEDYLDRIARIVGWAKAEGICVIVDMHQDLYSVKFSDGAPAWATLDEDQPYQPTPVWSDAYFVSEAVQASLDHFWANSAAPDGVGLQDHYARVWRRVAEKFRNEPAVLGFDLMNEPYPGRDNARNRQAMFAKVVELLPAKLGAKMPPPEKLATATDTPEWRQQMAEWLGDIELFAAILKAGTPIMQAFERDRLQPMYARVHKSIREVDTDHIIFIEPTTTANIGIASAIAPLVDEHGRRDPQQAYAPHAYDIVTDTPQSGTGSSNARVELIFQRHAAKAKELKMPLLIGEWGAYYEDPNAVEAAKFVVHQLDALECSDTYWDYQRKLQNSPLLPALKRHSMSPSAK